MNNRPKLINLKKNRGFTLVEFLLSLYIISIIALCLYSTFSQGMKLNARSRQHNGLYRQANIAMGLISKDLQNAVLYDFTNSYPDKKDFQGEANSLAFFIPTADGLHFVRYYLVASSREEKEAVIIANRQTHNHEIIQTEEMGQGRGNYLIREEGPFADYINGPLGQESRREIICKEIKKGGLRFTYGDRQKRKSDSETINAVWERKGIPTQITLEMDFQPSGANPDGLTLKRKIFIPQGTDQSKG